MNNPQLEPAVFLHVSLSCLFALCTKCGYGRFFHPDMFHVDSIRKTQLKCDGQKRIVTKDWLLNYRTEERTFHADEKLVFNEENEQHKV